MLRNTMVAIVAAALLLAFAASQAAAESQNSPFTVTLWREIPGNGQEQLKAGAVITDHMFIQNTREDRIPGVTTSHYWSSPSLIYIGWTGVGANAEAWSLQTIDNSNFNVAYLPEAGIEPNGVGEMIIIFAVKDASLWPVFPAPQQAQAEHTAQQRLLTALAPQVLLSDKIDLHVDARPTKLTVSTGTGAYQVPFFTANLKTPYALTLLGRNQWPTTVSYGDRAKECDTKVSTNANNGGVTLTFGSCLFSSTQYTAALTNEAATIIPKEGVRLTNQDGNTTWRMYPGEHLTLELGLRQAQLKLPKSQGVEFTYFDPEQKKEVTSQVWFDGTNWLAAPRPPAGTHTRFFGHGNFHTVTLDRGGAVSIAQFPYRTIPRSTS